MRAFVYSEETIDMLNNVCEHTMAVVIGIRFTAIGPDFLQAVMPVDDRTRQPYGLLHGGASAALAETVGSVASSLLIDQAREICVGMELNCNHLRGKTEGIVTATARPLHTGRTTHVWDIRICDEQERLVCISRLTVAIRKRKDK
jgi:1,4-dihydroxy-2-naphthoyl-CoA hydrolase